MITVSKKLVNALLVVSTVTSWALFPILLKFMNPEGFKTLFGSSLLVAAFLSWHYLKVNGLYLLQEYKLFFALWLAYLIALTIATISAGEIYSYQQLATVYLKVFFFFFLFLYIKGPFIGQTFSIYANFMVLCTITSIGVALGVAMGVIEPIATLRNEVSVERHYLFDVYLGAYYGLSPLYAPFPLFRLQGFAEEPGTFAFSLLPALYWMLLKEKNYVRSFIIGVGLAATVSLGALAFIIIIIPLLWRELVMMEQLLLVGIIAINVGYRFFGYVLDYLQFFLLERPQGAGYDIWLNSQDSGHTSWGDRLDAISIVCSHLANHPIGTGAGLGMTTVEYPVAVGFANAALESGVAGGLFYCLMFILLTGFALKQVWGCSGRVRYSRVQLVVSLSVLSCIFMGLQRQQPDISFWHMWIYASFFYLALGNLNKKDGESSHAI